MKIKSVTRPPLGIMPKEIYYRQVMIERLNDLIDAINRYNSNGIKIPTEWINEYNDLVGLIER